MNWNEGAAIVSQMIDPPAEPGDLSDPVLVTHVHKVRTKRLVTSGTRHTSQRVAKHVLDERGIHSDDILACRDLPITDLDLLAALAAGLSPSEIRAGIPDPQTVWAMAALRGVRLPPRAQGDPGSAHT